MKFDGKTIQIQKQPIPSFLELLVPICGAHNYRVFIVQSDLRESLGEGCKIIIIIMGCNTGNDFKYEGCIKAQNIWDADVSINLKKHLFDQ